MKLKVIALKQNLLRYNELEYGESTIKDRQYNTLQSSITSL